MQVQTKQTLETPFEGKMVQVQTETLDGLLARLSLDPAGFDFMYLDVQGAGRWVYYRGLDNYQSIVGVPYYNYSISGPEYFNYLRPLILHP